MNNPEQNTEKKVNFSFLPNNVSQYDINFSYTPYSQNEWVNYGDGNVMPEKILQLTRFSPTHSSIIFKKAEYIAGKDVIITGEYNNLFIDNIDRGEGLHQLIYKMALDYVTFGGYCLQILKDTETGLINEIVFQDFSKVRRGWDTRKQENLGVWISRDWQQYNHSLLNEYKPKFYNNFKESETTPFPTFYYFKIYTQGIDWYPLPTWNACINSIVTEIELINFKKNSVTNSFTTQGILEMPNAAPNAEVQDQIEKELNNKHKGTSNSGNIMVSFTDSSNAKPISYVALSNNPAARDVSGYMEQSKNEILVGHRIPHPSLIGLPTPAGFSSEAALLETASFEFFDKQLAPIQNHILKDLEWLIMQSGSNVNLSIDQNYPFIKEENQNENTI